MQKTIKKERLYIPMSLRGTVCLVVYILSWTGNFEIGSANTLNVIKQKKNILDTILERCIKLCASLLENK